MKENKEMRKLKNKYGITLVALVVTIVVLIILATISINIIFGEEGIVERVKQAKQDMANAQEEEEQILAETANSIDGYIIGEREQISVDKEEYEQLKSDVENLKKHIYGLEYNSILTSSIDVPYNTNVKIYTKTFTEDTLANFSVYAIYDSYSQGNVNYGVLVTLDGKMISISRTGEISGIDSNADSSISHTTYVKKGSTIDIYLYQASKIGTINVQYALYGNI